MIKSVCCWQLAARHGRRNHGRGSTRPGGVWVDVETARSYVTVTTIVGGRTVGSGHGVEVRQRTLEGAQIVIYESCSAQV